MASHRFFGHSLAVHIEQPIDATGLDSQRHDALDFVSVDTNLDCNLLSALDSLLSRLSFHLLQAGDEGFGFADGERGHLTIEGGGVAPGLLNCTTLPGGLEG